uniref:CCHC-type domain-containing protein n=1 Tax=Scleropages formosus TaxID=113540 RepID=A0A8C9TQH4_SCLFO
MAFGKPEDFHFDESEEQFDAYLERLEQYFAANGLGDTEKTKAVFLTIVGKRTHSLLMDLCTPLKPAQKTFMELIALLKNHYVPWTNFIAERCKFHSRNQLDGESISEYVANLRKLSATCKFGQFLDEALRDRFVCGVKSAELRDRLLNAAHSKDVPLALAIEMLAFEVTLKSSQQFSQKTFKTHGLVEKKGSTKAKDAIVKLCYRCNGKGHKPDACRFKDVNCHVCGKRGHVARACRTRSEGQDDAAKQAKLKWTKHLDAATLQDHVSPYPKSPLTARSNELCASDCIAHDERGHGGGDYHALQLQEAGLARTTTESRVCDGPKESDIQGTELFAIDTNVHKVNKPYCVYVQINNVRVKMEVDTGAAVSVISEKLYHCRFYKVKLAPANCVLKTYSKESLELKGKITVRVKSKDQTHMLDLMVVKGNGPSLMGRDWISHLNLDWSRINKVTSETMEQLCDRYSSVFQPNLGMLKGISAKLHVVKEAMPKFCKPRTVPYALRDSVEQELCKLEAEDVISPVSYSEWAAPIVCIPKRTIV